MSYTYGRKRVARALRSRRWALTFVIFAFAAALGVTIPVLPAAATTSCTSCGPGGVVASLSSTAPKADHGGQGEADKSREGFGTTSDPAAQSAATLAHASADVDPAVLAQVKNVIMTSPKTIIAALNTLRPSIRLLNNPIQNGVLGFFDPTGNQIVLTTFGGTTFLRETTEHELAHAWDFVNHVTGAYNDGGSKWQNLASQAFRHISPGSLGLTAKLLDPPMIAGVGSGDVMAEMVAAMSDDQTGNGSAMARAWPELADFLRDRLRID